jgi:hypothetical protein
MVATLVALAAVAAVAQDAATIPPAAPKLEDVKTPPSPAFVLLGISPTDVQRPTTPRALAVALLSSVQDSSGTPKNVALEVAPYWLQERPTLSFDDYDLPTLAQSFIQTLSISVAMKPSETSDGKTTPTTGGLGARAAWVLGGRSKLEQQVINAYYKKVGDLAAENDPTAHPIGETDTVAEAKRFSEILKPYGQSIRDASRQGRWIIEAAAAVTAAFPENKTDQRTTQKTGFWLTPSYRMNRSTFDPKTGKLTETPTVDVIGVIRTINDRTATGDKNPLDIGGRLLWDSGTMALSAEHVQRTRATKKSHRTSAMIEFKLNNDIYLSGTLGRNFDDANPNGNLLAIFGINFNVGKTPSLIVPPQPSP